MASDLANNRTITFPTPFTSKPMSITANKGKDASWGPYQYPLAVNLVTSTKFVGGTGGDAAPIRWIAIGK